MKQGIPWPIKFGAKLVFGGLRINYRVLKRLRIVEHGRMEDPNFARDIFNFHVLEPEKRSGSAPRGALLELGPGDSLATGALGLSHGFSRVFLVDAGRFADLSSRSINMLFGAL